MKTLPLAFLMFDSDDIDEHRILIDGLFFAEFLYDSIFVFITALVCLNVYIPEDPDLTVQERYEQSLREREEILKRDTERRMRGKMPWWLR